MSGRPRRLPGCLGSALRTTASVARPDATSSAMSVIATHAQAGTGAARRRVVDRLLRRRLLNRRLDARRLGGVGLRGDNGGVRLRFCAGLRGRRLRERLILARLGDSFWLRRYGGLRFRHGLPFEDERSDRFCFACAPFSSAEVTAASNCSLNVLSSSLVVLTSATSVVEQLRGRCGCGFRVRRGVAGLDEQSPASPRPAPVPARPRRPRPTSARECQMRRRPHPAVARPSRPRSTPSSQSRSTRSRTSQSHPSFPFRPSESRHLPASPHHPRASFTQVKLTETGGGVRG